MFAVVLCGGQYDILTIKSTDLKNKLITASNNVLNLMSSSLQLYIKIINENKMQFDLETRHCKCY